VCTQLAPFVRPGSTSQSSLQTCFNAVMWGRHDKRTKKGKRYIGECNEISYCARWRGCGHFGNSVFSLRRHVREDQTSQTRRDSLLAGVLGPEDALGPARRRHWLATAYRLIWPNFGRGNKVLRANEKTRKDMYREDVTGSAIPNKFMFSYFLPYMSAASAARMHAIPSSSMGVCVCV